MKLLIVKFQKNEKESEGNIKYVKIPENYENYTPILLETIKDLYKLRDYTHFFITETDCDIEKITENDYAGFKLHKREGSRTWHYRKVSEKSSFKKEIYKGEFSPWFSMKSGFLLSRKSLRIILRSETNEIYPDVMIAKLLRMNGIFPTIF